ncbi:MAG: hypothetical protein PHN80_16655 [Hespellia sp.]|nr:hypothetical protein [Hespellia sp.]
MLDRAQFMETLESVAEIIRTSTEPLSQEEILGYFKDMELTEEQKTMVVNYYRNPQAEENGTDSEDLGSGTENTGRQTEVLDEVEHISPVLQMYLDDIAALPEYTGQEKMNWYQRLIAGDDAVIKNLSDCWLARVLEIARKRATRKTPLEDLVQEGNIGLFLKLQELLGSGKMDDFDAVISASVEEAIWAYINEVGAEDDGDHTVVGKVTLVQEAKKLLEEQLEREASLKELSDYTKMDEEELREILNLAEKANRA